jgi:hypothetical protein
MWCSIRMRGCDLPYIDYDDGDMVKICCNGIERSCHRLEDIDIEGFGNDDILTCIHPPVTNISKNLLFRFIQ